MTSVETSAGKVTSIDGVSPTNGAESWLARIDHEPEALAGEQTVAFGDVVSLRMGIAPGGGQSSAGPAGPAGPTGATGKQGKPGEPGKRGARGRPGRNAAVSCRVRKHRVRCTVEHDGRHKKSPRKQAGH